MSLFSSPSLDIVGNNNIDLWFHIIKMVFVTWQLGLRLDVSFLLRSSVSSDTISQRAWILQEIVTLIYDFTSQDGFCNVTFVLSSIWQLFCSECSIDKLTQQINFLTSSSFRISPATISKPIVVLELKCYQFHCSLFLGITGWFYWGH